MKHRFVVELLSIWVLLVSSSRCHEFVALNLPSRTPYAMHPSEELQMDLSEVHPLFLYAASQNDFMHQHGHGHTIVRPLYKPNHPPKPQLAPTQPTSFPNQQRRKPFNTPPLTYGFEPKPSNRHAQRPRQAQQNQNGGSRKPHLQRHAFQPIDRTTEHSHRTQFAENIQVQASVQKHRQSMNSHSSRNVPEIPRDQQRNINFHPKHLGNNRNFNQPTNHRGPSKNNHDARPFHGRDRSQNPPRDERRQESTRKHASFADAVKALKNRNVPRLEDEYSLLPPHHHSLHQQSLRVSNERMNMQQHGRGMRIENRPQLPSRPPFQNGGIKINTAAGELPSIDLHSFNNVNRHTNNFRNGKSLHRPDADDEKKTYLLFKAPSAATTENPSFVLENLRDTPSYILNGLTETTIHLPEIFPTAEPITMPQNQEAPIVLDLVQIPDPALFSHPQKHGSDSDRNFSNEQSEAHRYNVEPVQRPPHRENHQHQREPESHSSTRLFDNEPEVYQHEDDPRPEHSFNDQNINNHAQVYHPVHRPEPSTLSGQNNHEQTYHTEHSSEPGPHDGPNNRGQIYHAQHVSEPIPVYDSNNHEQRHHTHNNLESSPPNQLSQFDQAATPPRSVTANHEQRYHTQNNLESSPPNQPTQFDQAATPPRSVTANHEQRVEAPHYRPDPVLDVTVADQRETSHRQYFSPTESYPTTPYHTHENLYYKSNQAYFGIPEESHQRTIPKPKLRELGKPLNASLHHPISYSSSVSIVSVKKSVDTKQSVPKKQKQSVKKALPAKKKVPANDDYAYDDHYDDQHSVPGEPGIDYPTYKDIPTTAFTCKSFKTSGFYADLETGCQVFHNCDTNKSKHSFMCPNGTIFHQELLICDWWYNVRCDDSREFYSLNSGQFADDDFEKRQ